MKPRTQTSQLSLPLRSPGRGGARPGAGRPPAKGNRRVAHRPRPHLTGRHPLHVTFRLLPDVSNLRSRRCFRLIERAFIAGCDRDHFRLTHHCVQGNHLHLIAEADDAPSLSKGLQGLAVRIARSLNRLMGRTGTVFADRYHVRVLKTPREVRNAVLYVLNNARRHAYTRGHGYSKAWIDPFSSACWFDGWSRPVSGCGPPGPGEQAVASVAPPRTWLLREGWRRHGLLDPSTIPSSTEVSPRRGRASR